MKYRVKSVSKAVLNRRQPPTITSNQRSRRQPEAVRNRRQGAPVPELTTNADGLFASGWVMLPNGQKVYIYAQGELVTNTPPTDFATFVKPSVVFAAMPTPSVPDQQPEPVVNRPMPPTDSPLPTQTLDFAKLGKAEAKRLAEKYATKTARLKRGMFGNESVIASDDESGSTPAG